MSENLIFSYGGDHLLEHVNNALEQQIRDRAFDHRKLNFCRNMLLRFMTDFDPDEVRSENDIITVEKLSWAIGRFYDIAYYFEDPGTMPDGLLDETPLAHTETMQMLENVNHQKLGEHLSEQLNNAVELFDRVTGLA